MQNYQIHRGQAGSAPCVSRNGRRFAFNGAGAGLRNNRRPLLVQCTAAVASLSREELTADGLKWAYRKAIPSQEKAGTISAPPLLLLHGLGSSSYSYRTSLELLSEDGVEAIAPDWPGHGDSDKPTSGFDYSEGAYLAALDAFVQQSGIKQPFGLVVHGFVLGQYALLYALEHPGSISRLFILNTPLALSTKLRPELAAYKSPLPFLRPSKDTTFDGGMFNITGSPYEVLQATYDEYSRPYLENPSASAAIAATMEGFDYTSVVKRVDDGYCSWRQPSVLMFGAADPFIDLASTFQFLESKRTNMKVLSAPAKLGHAPHEDYAEALHEVIIKWAKGETDEWSSGAAAKINLPSTKQ